jgi:hypothetical protein
MKQMAGARPGTSLYMVILLTGILFMMSAMLPQILVQASGAIRIDRSRDLLMDAVDSGIAFGEARLKRDLTNHVTSWSGNGDPAQTGPKPPAAGFVPDKAGPSLQGMAGWVVHPTFDNPDFGQRKQLNFEVRCLKVALFHVQRTEVSETSQFHYSLDAGAWENKGEHNRHVEVNGVITLNASIDRHGNRTVNDVQIQSINREIMNRYVALAPGASPPPLP